MDESSDSVKNGKSKQNSSQIKKTTSDIHSNSINIDSEDSELSNNSEDVTQQIIIEDFVDGEEEFKSTIIKPTNKMSYEEYM